MECKLFINTVFYKLVENDEWIPDISWAVLLDEEYYRRVGSALSSVDDFQFIIFRHCGLGHYYCDMSQEKENRIRKRTTKTTK